MYLQYKLQLHEASEGVAAGHKVARENGWPVTVAVVDECGFPILVARMDGASVVSVDTAIEKARSAAYTGMETKFLEELIRARPAVVTMKRVAVEGGIPILHKGTRVGGIGVSGVMSDQDAVVAKSALDAIADLLASIEVGQPA